MVQASASQAAAFKHARWRVLELLANGSAALVKLRWIRGHLEEEAAIKEQAKHDARGKKIAGSQANVSRERHPQAPTWLQARVARKVEHVNDVLLHAARVLTLWPRATKEKLKAVRPTAGRRGRRVPVLGHHWVFLGSRWQCKECLAAAFLHDAVVRRAVEECPGVARRLCRVVAEVADVDCGPCLFRVACGAWCTIKPHNFLDQCFPL